MTPTNKLRFVEREVFVQFQNYKDVTQPKTVRILQQWWENKTIVLAIHVEDKDGNPLPPPTHGEWRDVPVEKNT